jgi:hypothetical protein
MFKRTFPDSEYRRVYMRKLVDDLRAVCGLGGKEARDTARHMIQLLEAKLHAGEEVDLGFLKIQPRKVKPAEIRFNLDPTNPDRHFLGEGVRWRVHFIKSWLKNSRPPWSRH